MRQQKSFLQDGHLWLPCVIVLLAFALRLHLLDQQSLWWDEIKTIDRATNSIKGLMVDLVYFKKGHVPLYFLMMQLWGRIGVEPFVMRAFSVLGGSVAVALLWWLGYLLGKRPLANTAAFLLAISPFHIWYSQEARMYSLVTALAIGGAISLLYSVRTNRLRWWLVYALVMGIGVYTHYFMLLVIFAHALAMALSFRQLRAAALRWFAAAAVVGMAFLPYVLAIRGSGGYEAVTPGWIIEARWFEPLLTLVAFSAGRTVQPAAGSTIVLTLLFGIGLLASLLPAAESKPLFSMRLVRLWFAAPLLIVFLVSLGLRPGFSLYMDRYLIIGLPAFLLLVGHGLLQFAARARHPIAAPLGALLIFLLTLPGLHHLYHNEVHFRTDVRGAVEMLAETAVTDIVLLGTPDVELPLKFYAAQSGLMFTFYPLPIDPATVAERELFVEAMAAQLENAAAREGDIWYLHQTFNRSPHGFPQPNAVPDVRAVWLDGRFDAVEQFDFPNVTLYRFEQ